MKLINLIQYVERRHTMIEAEDCLSSLGGLVGFVGGRATHSPKFGESAEYVCQAFFEEEEGVNPDSLEIAGMRSVSVPLSFLLNL